MNTSIPRKHFIVLALAIILAIASYWIPLPRESDVLQSEISNAAKSTLVDSTNFLVNR